MCERGTMIALWDLLGKSTVEKRRIFISAELTSPHMLPASFEALSSSFLTQSSATLANTSGVEIETQGQLAPTPLSYHSARKGKGKKKTPKETLKIDFRKVLTLLMCFTGASCAKLRLLLCRVTVLMALGHEFLQFLKHLENKKHTHSYRITWNAVFSPPWAPSYCIRDFGN